MPCGLDWSDWAGRRGRQRPTPTGSRSSSSAKSRRKHFPNVRIAERRFFTVPVDGLFVITNLWNNSRSFGTSLEQNRPFEGEFPIVPRREGNRINEIYGAGDGNRTHVRSLGACSNSLVNSDLRVKWTVPELSLYSFQVGAFPGVTAQRWVLSKSNAIDPFATTY